MATLEAIMGKSMYELILARHYGDVIPEADRKEGGSLLEKNCPAVFYAGDDGKLHLDRQDSQPPFGPPAAFAIAAPKAEESPQSPRRNIIARTIEAALRHLHA